MKEGLKLLNQKEQAIISNYVDADRCDIEKLIDYLNRNEVIGNELFLYIHKQETKEKSCLFSLKTFSETKYFCPVDRKTFFRRIPFYFYDISIDDLDKDKKKNIWGIKILSPYFYKDKEPINPNELEKFYSALETLYHEHSIELNIIMEYVFSQIGISRLNISDLFYQWADYINIIKSNNLQLPITPKCLMADYNTALEAAGRKPIIYSIDFDIPEWSNYYIRNSNELLLSGRFPINENNEPILKWIGINVKDIGKIEFDCNEYFDGTLKIELLPKSIVQVFCLEDNEWYQIYAGPQRMFFDHSIFKEKRKELNYTQQYIADSIEASVRTYQKWENGETVPDGENIIRLMNILDIKNIQLLIKYLSE